jgi:hypothetical protein
VDPVPDPLLENLIDPNSFSDPSRFCILFSSFTVGINY